MGVLQPALFRAVDWDVTFRADILLRRKRAEIIGWRRESWLGKGYDVSRFVRVQ